MTLSSSRFVEAFTRAVCVAWIFVAASPAVAQELVQVDFSTHFNGDAVLNSDGSLDQVQDGLDADGWSYVTESLPCAAPVPGNAFFAANADHPDVQLGWADDDDGDNAWQTNSGEAGTSITVDLPDRRYEQIHLFVGADQGGPGVSLTLTYATGAAGVVSWDSLPWYLGGGAGGGYVLAGGLSRSRWTGALNCADDTVTLIGRSFPVDPSRVLLSISLQRTGDTGRLSVFGATAVVARHTLDARLRTQFNADVVANRFAGDNDVEMGSLDGFWGFSTDTFGCGDDLPNDAAFPATATHPAVQLGWNNADNGLNAWQTFEVIGSITVEVPDIAYDEFHLFATGAWVTAATLTLHYATGDPDAFSDLAYPSWFDEAPAGYYNLIDGLDRAFVISPTTQTCEDVNDPAIVGRSFAIDSGRALDRFTIERTDSDSEGVLTVFGATLVAQEPLIFYDDFESGDFLYWSEHP